MRLTPVLPFPPESEAVIIAGQPASIRWRRSARARRIALKIDPKEGDIVITLPPNGSRRAGLALLRGHEAWVAARLASLPPPLSITSGGTIPVCGKPHLIVHMPASSEMAEIRNYTILVAGQPECLNRRVRDALRAFAHERFAAIAREKSSAIGARLRHVRIKDTKSRWGSCAADGTLMLSWRLVMAPEFVQDYVIAHEVAHLRHMNHGPAFWALTERLTPYRVPATTWLATQGPGLLRIS